MYCFVTSSISLRLTADCKRRVHGGLGGLLYVGHGGAAVDLRLPMTRILFTCTRPIESDTHLHNLSALAIVVDHGHAGLHECT